MLKVTYREGERRRKARVLVSRAEEKSERAGGTTVKSAVFSVLMEAWAKATDDGAYPVSARMHYPVRDLIQRYTSKDLDFGYFSLVDRFGWILRQSSRRIVALEFAQDQTLSWRAVVDRAIEQAMQGHADTMMEAFAKELGTAVQELGKR